VGLQKTRPSAGTVSWSDDNAARFALSLDIPIAPIWKQSLIRTNAMAAPYTKSDFQELVDTPNETLDVEYKAWLDLAENNEARADLARHIAALANHGGGLVVFGITDNMEFAGPNPFPKVVFDRDLVAGIVKRYLEPTFQCDVRIITSRTGNSHPVIIVPPHEATPICAKAGGPEINGKPKGIAQGMYYTRKAGPESSPILTVAEWAPIIRRCAMHERASILSAVDAALRGSNTVSSAVADVLKVWHDAARPIYEKDIADRGLPPFYSTSFYQMSYAIERANGQVLNLDGLIEILRQVNAEVRDLVATGWSMFYSFSQVGSAPLFQTDEKSGQGEIDFLECAHLRDFDPTVLATDMWRVSADGKATIIRSYLEDNAAFVPQTSLAQGTWFSPQMMVSELAEFVRHARGLAERFNEATTVHFRCEWRGLEKRVLYDPLGHFLRRDRAKRDHRVSSGAWPITALANSLEEIVAELGQPVIRNFSNDFVITPQWVKGQRKRWLSS
jgi:hypothetical protein